MNNIKPEEAVELKLWDWLKTKSKYVNEIYFNRKNIINSPVFTLKGLKKTPDFVIKIDRGYGTEYIVMEIKNNLKSSQVYDASKILNLYYDNYIKKLTRYFINNEEIKINHFVIATQGSKNAKLLNDNVDIEITSNKWHINNSVPHHRTELVNLGHEPEWEWNGSSQFLRRLFSDFRQYRDKNNLKCIPSPSLGILTSKIDISDNGAFYCDNEPFLFIMSYNDYNQQFKSKWGCRYWAL
jgi:hypothetical protein